jgi:hypothetical protein
MKVLQAVTFWLNYHRANSSNNTIRAYKELMARFCQENGDKDLNEQPLMRFYASLMASPKAKSRKPERRGFHTSHPFSILPKTILTKVSKILVIFR